MNESASVLGSPVAYASPIDNMMSSPGQTSVSSKGTRVLGAYFSAASSKSFASPGPYQVGRRQAQRAAANIKVEMTRLLTAFPCQNDTLDIVSPSRTNGSPSWGFDRLLQLEAMRMQESR
jgi:hypothetical protein